MDGEQLEFAGGRIFGLPDRQFGPMMPKELGQVTGILGIDLGAGGDEGFTILLERERIDGVDRDPGIGFEEGNDRPGGLLNAQADPGGGILLAQLGQPVVERLGLGGDHLEPALTGVGVDEVQAGLAVGTIQAND